MILLIVETEGRLTQLRRIAEAVVRAPGGAWDVGASFHFATLAAVLGREGPLACGWDAIGASAPIALLPPTVSAMDCAGVSNG